MSNDNSTQWSQAARRAVPSGLLAAAFSTGALMLGSKVRGGGYASGLNGPSQWLWGEKEAYEPRVTLRHTLPGAVIHVGTSFWWATIHERWFGNNAQRKSAGRKLVEAVATTSVAYVVDYHLTPPRFRPGFEKHVGPVAFVAVYAGFAAGLAAAALLRGPRARRRDAAPPDRSDDVQTQPGML
jgi:hypothetical protein